MDVSFDNFSDIECEAYNYYAMLSIMQYRTILFYLSGLSQLWEEKFIEFTNLNLTRNPHNTMKEFTNFQDLLKFYKNNNVNFEELLCWHEINELRLLVNAIKHGRGSSYNKLLELYPKYEQNKELQEISNMFTFVELYIHIEPDEVLRFAEAVKDFWSEFPQEIYV